MSEIMDSMLISTLATGSRMLPDTLKLLVSQLKKKVSISSKQGFSLVADHLSGTPSIPPADPPASAPPCSQVHTVHAPQNVFFHHGLF